MLNLHGKGADGLELLEGPGPRKETAGGWDEQCIYLESGMLDANVRC